MQKYSRKISLRQQQQLSFVGIIIAPILFGAVLIISGFIRPGYSFISQPGSDLGSGWQGAWIFSVCLSIFGLLIIIFAVGFYQRMQLIIGKGRLKAASGLLVVAGIDALVVGIMVQLLHSNQILPSDQARFAIFFITPAIAQLLVGTGIRRNKSPAWQNYGRYSIASGALGLILTGLLGFANFSLWHMLDSSPSLAFLSTLLIYQVQGVYQLVEIAVIDGWFVVTGLRLFLTFEKPVEKT